MTDTINLDVTEKVDILLKQSFGFPSTSENNQWYEISFDKKVGWIKKQHLKKI